MGPCFMSRTRAEETSFPHPGHNCEDAAPSYGPSGRERRIHGEMGAESPPSAPGDKNFAFSVP